MWKVMRKIDRLKKSRKRAGKYIKRMERKEIKNE